MRVHAEPALPRGYLFRPAGMEDLEALVALFNVYLEPLFGARRITVDYARRIFTTPGFNMASSTRVVQSPDGHLVGCMVVSDLISPPVYPEGFGCVHPDSERQGIGTLLLTWAEERARQAIPRVPDGIRVALRVNTSTTHEPTKRLFEKVGLKAVRYSWFMVAELDEALAPPQWPANIVPTTFRDCPDAVAVYRAVDDAFQDRWGYVAGSDGEGGFARLQHQIAHDNDFDPTLWFLAKDGDEIAGVALCELKTGEDSTMGKVDALGVRRPWRRQGLGLALLFHALGEFHRRGLKRVGLGVDAGSLTGATRLYEKAGMRVVRQSVTFELELRAGREMGVQTIDA